MAETPQQIIPIFKEKVIYFGGSQTGEGGTSYAVSASYRGIIRLSPNNADLLKSESSTLNYADSIGSYIGETPLQVSDSDGNLLDMAYTKENVTISKVYTIGIASPKKLYFYTDSTENFTISGIKMPVIANEMCVSDFETEEPKKDLPYGPTWKRENSSTVAKHTDIIRYYRKRCEKWKMGI